MHALAAGLRRFFSHCCAGCSDECELVALHCIPVLDTHSVHVSLVVLQMLTSPATVNFELLNTTAAVLAQVSSCSPAQAQEPALEAATACRHSPAQNLQVAQPTVTAQLRQQLPHQPPCAPFAWLFQAM
jgi:hypothetical protein